MAFFAEYLKLSGRFEAVAADALVTLSRPSASPSPVRPDVEDERRFAAVRRLSEINLGLYRTLLQPFVRAFASEQVASWQHELQPSELPFKLFSDRNPLMRHPDQGAGVTHPCTLADIEPIRNGRSPSARQPG